MLLGEKGLLPKVDYDYCWDNIWKQYPDIDHSKRVLGTILMHCFALSDRYWLFIDDPEKKQKIKDGDIPEVTEYFLEQDGSKFKDYKWPASMRKGKPTDDEIDGLKKKFGKKK